MRTWSEMVAYHAARRPDALFVRDDTEEATYAEMSRRLARRATWLVDRGVEPGSRVALLARNSVALVETLLACHHLGAVGVPLNHRLSTDEIAYLIGHSESHLLVVDPEFGELAGRAVAGHPGTPAVAELRPAAESGLGDLAPAAPVEVGLDDVCRIMYTSGTTSRPKGVALTNRNILVKCAAQAREFGLSFRDHGLVAGPLFHIAALDVTLTNAAYVGGSVRLLRRFDADRVLDHLRNDGVTHVWLAPVMIRRVLEAARQAGGVVLDGGPRLMIGGGEPTPRELMERIATVFPNTWYANVYGLTETSTGDTVLPQSQAGMRPTSVGLAVAESTVRVLDPEGRPVAPGEHGQVAIGGPKLSQGYWRDPEATAASRHEGFFLTGDEGYLDDEGYLFITGRFKDVIISGGENIGAAEVERVLVMHQAVAEAAIVGRPDPQWGEVPVAFVVARQGASLEVADLDEHCREKLGLLKTPKEYRLLSELPRTAIGKVHKAQLRELLGRGES
ncbi:class I adenylate-forming enzyme family protein [Streptomyces sp. Tue6028]|uniref:class I adenylate-forming enzyme family protein n=1 Tax=Streptomyces sp. Tue6028 TaxID=2036037 RepID=UPI003EBA5651